MGPQETGEAQTTTTTDGGEEQEGTVTVTASEAASQTAGAVGRFGRGDGVGWELLNGVLGAGICVAVTVAGVAGLL